MARQAALPRKRHTQQHIIADLSVRHVEGYILREGHTAQRVETLFLTALSRPPTAAELQKYSSYVESGGAAKDRKKALADVFWALLNTKEFLFNH